MADAISETAELFRQEIGGGPAPSGRSERRETPAERMFTNLGRVENDGERAGGDPDGDVDYEVDGDGNLVTDSAGNPIPIRSKPAKPAKSRDPDEDEDDEQDDDADEKGEDGDEDEGDDEDDDDPILKRKYAVQVDGEEEEVTLGEAVRGYIRQKTFHKRLTALNEEKIAVQTERSTLQMDRQKVAKQLDDLAAEFEAVLPPEPNWDEMFQKNPGQARALQKQYEGLKGKITEYRQKRDAAAAEAQAKAVEEFKVIADNEFRRFVGQAKWRNAEEAQKGLDTMRTAAKRMGFTDQEIDTTIDSRMLMVLLKAAKYDDMVGKRPRPVKDIRRSARANEERPGESRQSSTGVARDRNNGQFTRRREHTNSIDAAAAVFEQLISKPRGRRRG